MPKLRDMVGQMFGKLTVVSRVEAPGKVKWVCRCSCGGFKEARSDHLISGGIRSCGCIVRSGINSRKHGMAGHRLYKRWENMMYRCYRKKDVNYHNYGGRGIRVCKRWHNPVNFIKDMYPTFEEGLTLDRKEVNGNYNPSNCRWATIEEQVNNKRNTVYVLHEGERVPAAVLARRMGVTRSSIRSKLARGKLEHAKKS